MRAGYNPTLAQIFNFDAVDLAANRIGQLSPDQAAMFRNTARAARRRPKRIGLMLQVATIVMSLYVLATNAPLWQLWAMMGISIAVSVIIMLISLLNLRHARAVEMPVVRVAQGQPRTSPSFTAGQWWMEVGGVRFAIEHTTTMLFKRDVTYRIYHADVGLGSPGILSLEVVDGTR